MGHLSLMLATVASRRRFLDLYLGRSALIGSPSATATVENVKSFCVSDFLRLPRCIFVTSFLFKIASFCREGRYARLHRAPGSVLCERTSVPQSLRQLAGRFLNDLVSSHPSLSQCVYVPFYHFADFRTAIPGITATACSLFQ